MKRVTEEMLMAFADGELDAATAKDVARAVENDAELADRLKEFERTRIDAKRAFAGVLEAPVPVRLVSAAGGGRGLARSSRWLPWGLGTLSGALAAALALVLLATPDIRTPVSPFAGNDIIAALESAASSETVALAGGGSLEVSGTYVTPGGTCRVFRLTGGATPLHWLAAACRHDGTWRVEIAVADVGDGFVPAADGAVASLDAYLDSLGAGVSLGADEEAELIGRHWTD